MKKIGNLVLIVVLTAFSQVLLAANFQVQATVDRNQMGIGDSFTLNLRITGDDDFELSEPKIPNVAGLELLNSWAGGTQVASSMGFENGKPSYSKSVTKDYNFQFSPQKEGTFSIPVIDVNLQGKSYRTDPIKIQVAEEYRNAGRRQNRRPPGRPQFPPGFGDEEDPMPGQMPDEEDLFSQLMRQRQQLLGQIQNGGGQPGFGQQGQIQSRKLDVNMNDAFFVYLDLDKTEVYEGEQVTANWYIYTRGNLESLDRVKFPDLKGFWKEIIEEVPSLQFIPEMVNGVMYRKALLASHALFPIKAGNSTIDEFRVKGKVRQQSQFGWGPAREFTKTSKRTAIKVLPLPAEGKTVHFSGAVGSYRITAKTDGTSFPAHQPFSVKVRFEGIGNAKLIDLPVIEWPEGLEVFDTKNESKYFKDGQSFKEFEILVIPRKEGDVSVPPLSFSYFDPSQKKYITQNTDEIKLKITPGQAQANISTTRSGTVSPVAAKEVEFQPQPILELPQAGFMWRQNRLEIFGAAALLVLLFCLTQFILGYRRFAVEPGFRENVQAKLKRIVTYKDPHQIGAEAVNLIYLLAAYLAGQKKANQEWSLLIKEIPLKSQNLYLARLTEIFDYFQLLGFSPEDVKANLVKQYPVADKLKDLQKISDEIVSQAKVEEQS